MSPAAVIGIYDHGGWAVLVTATADGTLQDRRRIVLVDDDLPSIPYHHEAQRLPLHEAEALVERVRLSAQRHARIGLAAVAAALPSLRIAGVALRECPPLPPTVAERLGNYRAHNMADWVTYRQQLAGAAESRGWAVHWFDAKKVIDQARGAPGIPDLDAHFLQVRKDFGPPWDKDHRVAMAAAIVAAARLG